jgi:hypothetical protein
MCHLVTLYYLLILLKKGMTCILSAFSTFLLLAYGLVVTSKWIVKKVQNNWDNVLRAVYNTYNLPETTYQRVKIRVNRDSR